MKHILFTYDRNGNEAVGMIHITMMTYDDDEMQIAKFLKKNESMRKLTARQMYQIQRPWP